MGTPPHPPRGAAYCTVPSGSVSGGTVNQSGPPAPGAALLEFATESTPSWKARFSSGVPSLATTVTRQATARAGSSAVCR